MENEILLTNEQFNDRIVAYFKEKYGAKAQVEVRPVLKNNQVCRDGLSILQPGENISPTIYLGMYYEMFQNGAEFDELADRIDKVYRQNRHSAQIEIDFFKDFKQIQGKLAFKLINYDKNKELLLKVPHRKYLDFAIVYYCLIHDRVLGEATILIHENHREMWNVTEEQLYQTALMNTPKLLPCAMMELTKLILNNEQQEESEAIFGQEAIDACVRDEEDNTYPHMFVLTNKSRSYGAAVILYPGILRYFAMRVKSDLFILPSSIHETILLVRGDFGQNLTLQDIVQEVNDEQVAEEEILSYHIYEYSLSEDCIHML